MVKELVIPTEAGPIVFRPRQVVKCEGAYFMIESVNEVRNGRQVRMHQLNDADALKYYVPSAPMSNAPAAGHVPVYDPAAAAPAAAPAAVVAPAPTAPPPPPAAAAPSTPGQVPGAEAAPGAGTVPTGPAPEVAPQGEVPASMAADTANPEDGPKPIQGLTQGETQDGLASGKYTQDAEGNVFANPAAPSTGPNDAPNHIINPGAADNVTKQDVIDNQ